MHAIIHRLERNERWWLAEVVLRAAGAGLLTLCALLSCWCFRIAKPPSTQPGTPAELALAALAFVCLSAGIALLFEGTGLFRPVALPPRALLP